MKVDRNWLKWRIALRRRIPLPEVTAEMIEVEEFLVLQEMEEPK